MEADKKIEDHEAIKRTIQHYIDGAISGRGEDMKPAFHEGATIFGYVGDELFAGPIQGLFDWNDQNGPAKELVIRVVGVDIFETIATARLECDNWTGHKYTDFLSLLKVDGEWKIMNKVFHIHS